MSEVTRKRRGRPVTHEEARKSALRLINSHFHNPNGAIASIPVQTTDDDVMIMDYIAEQESSSNRPREAATD